MKFFSVIILIFLYAYLPTPWHEVVNGRRILKYNSHYIGKTFMTTQLMEYYKGYEGSDCRNNICSYKADYILDDFGNSYVDSDKFFLIPKNDPLKVIGSYISESDTWSNRLFNSPIKKVIIELPNGKTAEMSELGFKLDVAKGSDGDFAKFLPEVDSFRKNNFSNEWYCIDVRKGDKYLYFEDKAKRTISYYGLAPFIKIKGIARSIMNNQEISCVKLGGNDLRAFIILKHRLHYVKAPVNQYLLKSHNLCDAKNSQSCLKNVRFLETNKKNK